MAIISGTNSNETLNGTTTDDTIKGFGGRDFLNGLAGNDIIYGGDGNDVLSGDEGDDYLSGDDGNDVITGGIGVDQLRGGDGNDTLNGGAGDDKIIGANGYDIGVWAGSIFEYAISVNAAGNGTVRDLVTTGLDEGLDTLTAVEQLTFADYTIYLDGRNNAVLARDDSGSANNTTPTTFTAASLLANDFDYDAGSTKTITAVGSAVGGTVQLNGTNIVFTAAAGFSGNATFEYTVSDGLGSTDIGLVTVAVTDSTAQAPTLMVADASGNEDTAIALSISSALTDTDGSETLALTIEGVPVGAKISDGVNTFTATAGNTSVNISTWNKATLKVTPPTNSDADFALSVKAVSTETNGGATSQQTGTINVTVAAVADTPSLSTANAVGNMNTAIALNVSSALTDTDGSESLTLTIENVPEGATLSDGTHTFLSTAGSTTATISTWNLATLTITPPANSHADFNLTVRAASTEAIGGSTTNTTSTIAVQVDDVSDTTASAPSLTVNNATGNEDSAIALSVNAALTDTDGSESLAVTIESIPVGAVLSDGTHNFTATAGNTTANVTTWNLATLTVKAPANSDADFTLNVRAVSTESVNGSTAETTGSISVTVDGVADAPTLSTLNSRGLFDTAIPVKITTALTDTDGSESLHVEIDAIPVGATLSDGTHTFTASAGSTTASLSGWNLASLTVTPPTGSTTDFQLTVRSIATEAVGGDTETTTATLNVDVTASLTPLMVFSGKTTAAGRELFGFDGNNTYLIADIAPGTANSAPGELGAGMVQIGNFIYFTATDPTNGYELRRLDISSGTVSLVADINPGSANGSPGQFGGLVEFNGDVYFTAQSPTIGRELFKVDGDTGALTPYNLNPGVAASEAGRQGSFFEFDGDLYFKAIISTRERLVRIDGDTGQSQIVDPTNQNFTIIADQGYVELNGDLYFTAKGKNFGVELHKLDGDTDLITRVSDISAGAADSNVGETGFIAFNGDLYFLAQNTAANTGKELYKMDGDTGAITSYDVAPGANGSIPDDFYVFGGDLYFSARSNSNGRELFKLDGDTDQITMIDINVGPGNSLPGSMGGYTEFQGDLYFVATTSTTGAELFKLDGDTGAVSMVADIRTGTGSAFDSSSAFVVIGDRLYFSAIDSSVNLPSLYSYDGSTLTKLPGTDVGAVFPVIVDQDALV